MLFQSNAFQQYSYIVTQNIGNTYNWSTSGGAVVSGQGTNTVQVIWNNVYNAQLEVVESNGYCSDTAILDITITVSIVNQGLISGIRFFPNPTVGILLVEIPEEIIKEPLHLKLLDITGREIFLKVSETKSNIHILYFSALQPGIYLVYLEQFSTIIKVVVQR